MSIPLVEITRGAVVECVHRGDVAVVNSHGELLCSAGDPHKITYFRSAAKPIQALNVLISGAADRFEFTEEEIAVTCSSHYAEPYHLNAVYGILEKIGLQSHHILGGVVTSLNREYALKLAWEHTELNPCYSDCSGKHVGMLAVCAHLGYDIEQYLAPEHPCQMEVKELISTLCEIDKEKILIGIDGCSAPVQALPLRHMAMGFAQLARPEALDRPLLEAAETIYNTMTQHPRMIAGTGGFCTELIKKGQGKVIGKVGAEGVYCMGLRDQGIGVAIKVESGSFVALAPAAVHVLQEMELLSPDQLQSLSGYGRMDNLNDVKTVVGEIRPVFTLK